MARIAEMAERKNAVPKSNPVLKQIKGPSQISLSQTKAQTNTNVSLSTFDLALDSRTKESCISNKSTKRKAKTRRRRKEKAGISSKVRLFF